MGVTMAKHYVVELSTKVPIVLGDDEVADSNNLIQLIVDKTQELIDNYDLNENDYKFKLIGQEGVEGATTEKENAV